MFYPYFSGSIFPAICLSILILGVRSFHTCENKAKGDASLYYWDVAFICWPSSVFIYFPRLGFLYSSTFSHSLALGQRTISGKISPSPFFHFERIETNRLGTVLHHSRTDRRQTHSPLHCQGDTKPRQALVLSKVWTMAISWTPQHKLVVV